MKDILEFDVPVQERQVDIVHILKDGRVIMQRDIKPYDHLFTWLDHNQIQHMVSELKPRTDEHRKSIVAVFETGEVRTYPNVSKNFTNYGLLNKSGL
jgi:hypothetical protein